MMAAMNNQHHSITLKQLLADVFATSYLPEIEITGLALDSRKVEPGYAFVAMEGQLDHGLVYAEKAIQRGAVVVLCDADYDQYCQQILSRLMTKVMCVPVKNLHRKLGEIAKKFYADPANDMFIVGTTGTDGKTSVSQFIAQAMNKETSPAAVIGTLGNGIVDQQVESTHTTPDVISVYEMLSEYRERGTSSVAMEVSSHGLDQDRVSGIRFDVAVLTNLTRDHLDYHGTVEAYKQAKRKLFSELSSKSVVLNIDDDFGAELFSEIQDDRDVWLYGMNEKVAMQSPLYAYAENVSKSSGGSSFMLSSSHGVAEVTLPLIGDFNIYNALACFCVLMQSGMNFNHAVMRLQNLHTVRGRMELIKRQGKPSIIIDYAHTPEALSQALMNVRNHVDGKLICVFGCGGDRDTGKRPLMAQVAEELSDLVIITNDNPRNEDADNIIDDIRQGISNTINMMIEPDRLKAIKHAVSMASENDLILIAGKGHEEYQIVGNKKLPFSDRQVALQCLEVNE